MSTQIGEPIPNRGSPSVAEPAGGSTISAPGCVGAIGEADQDTAGLEIEQIYPRSRRK